MTRNRSTLSSVQQAQQKGLLIGSGALVLYGLWRRSKFGAVLAATGGLLAIKSARSPASSQDYSAKAVFRVNASPETAYGVWRDLQGLPRFMAHLESVHVIDDHRSEWVARGPLNSTIQWTAEITEDQPNERIAWRSVPGSDIETSGAVAFAPHPTGRGTMVTASMRYALPGSAIAKSLISILGKNPEFMVREDLRRFKALLETGETPITLGQPHGPRGIHGKAQEALFREADTRTQPQDTSGDAEGSTLRATA